MIELSELLGTYNPINVMTLGSNAIALDIPYIYRGILMLMFVKFGFQCLLQLLKMFNKVT